jgi:hypothetical protein
MKFKICVCLYFLIAFIVITMGSDGWMIMALEVIVIEEVKVQNSNWTIMLVINMIGKSCDNVAKVNNIDNYVFKYHKFQQYVNSQPKRKTFFGVLKSWVQGDDLDSSII